MGSCCSTIVNIFHEEIYHYVAERLAIILANNNYTDRAILLDHDEGQSDLEAGIINENFSLQGNLLLTAVIPILHQILFKTSTILTNFKLVLRIL